MKQNETQVNRIYSLLWELRNSNRSVIHYLQGFTYGVPHPTSEELAKAVTQISEVAAYALQTKDRHPLDEISAIDPEPWLLLIDHDRERGRDWSEAARVVETLANARALKNEMICGEAQEKAIAKAASNQTRAYEPLSDNRLKTHPDEPFMAAETLFNLLIKHGFISSENHQAQQDAWLYLWGFQDYPKRMIKINWVADIGLLGCLMEQISRVTRHRNETAAKAFLYRGSKFTAATLTKRKSKIWNECNDLQAERLNTLTDLIIKIIGKMR